VAPLRVSLLSTFGSRPRGVNRYTEGLLSGLAGQELEISVFDYRQLYPKLLVPASRMAEAASGEEAIVHWASPATWRELTEKAAPLLHIQYWSPFTAYMLYFICRHMHALGKKVVLTVHNPASHETFPGSRFFERMLIKSADALIVHSSSGKEALLSCIRGLDPERVFVIPHGVEQNSSEKPRADDYRISGLSPDRKYVVMFGNLRGYKGIPTLLKAWRHVIDTDNDVDLILAGRLWQGRNGLMSRMVARILETDRVANEIAEMLEDSRLQQRVILREGFIPDAVIDAYCRISSLGVFPYDRFSGQSGAATRAAGWGLPLVVSNVGALPMLVADDGQLTEPGDWRGLARILLGLLAEPSVLEGIRSRQNRLIRDYAWNAVGARHLDVYEGLVRP